MDYKIIDIRDKMPVNLIRLSAGEKIPKRNKTERIVIHASDFKDRFNVDDVYQIAKYDITPSETNHLSKLGAFTFTYHYFIEYSNNEPVIYKCLNNNISSWHARGWNSTSLAIAVNKLANEQSLELKDRAIWLAARKCKELGLNGNLVFFHRELLNTGYIIDKDGIKRLLKECPGLVWNPYEFRLEVIKRMKG